MLVMWIWAANNWRNFNYLVACSETDESLAVDPLVLATVCFSAASVASRMSLQGRVLPADSLR